MTTPELIFAAIVFLVGIPAGFGLRRRPPWIVVRNLTAAALVASYFAVQGLYMASGTVLATRELVCIDLACIAAIYAKDNIPHPWCRDGLRYRSARRQVCAFWLELSVWDRIVLAIFPVLWAGYVLPVGAWQQWWLMWGLSLAQFIAAGAEPLSQWLSVRAANAGESDAPDIPSSGAEFHWARAGEYG